jgi:ADP-ribosyl-[dinitrogen reductase] hydrolase
MSDVEQRAIAAYLGLAVGDALGATVEFMTPREIAHHHGVHKEIIGGGWLRLKPGMVTDDTTMSLALGDALLEAGGVDAETIGRHFDQWMRNKPVDIGNTVRRGILHFRNKGETDVPPNEHDGGNGACMRVLPIAIATLGQDEATVQAATETQSHITHNNPLSDAGTLCVVRMIQMALQGTTIAQLRQGPVEELLQAHSEFVFRRKHPSDNPSGYIVHTLRVVFSALFDTDNFEDCLVDTVNRGGDADTTGAIAGMIVGAHYGLDAIPERWVLKLAGDTVERCREQAQALLTLSDLTA